MKTKSICVLLLLVFLSSPALALPLTFFEMTSIGDFVVPEGDYYYDENNSNIVGRNSYFSNKTYYQNSPSFNISYDYNRYWNLNFSTHELDGPMTVGVYDNAVRFPFEPDGVPGLSLSGNGRGNNTLTGTFEVLDIEYLDNTLQSFAATFEQNNRIFGKISYNSDVFASVPEPGSIILLLTGLFFIPFIKKLRIKL